MNCTVRIFPGSSENAGTGGLRIEHRGWDELKDLEARFAEVEERVRALVSGNKDLKKRVRELEDELARARHRLQELEHFHGKKMHVKEKIERILKALEALGAKEQAEKK